MKILQVITSLRTGGAEKLIVELVPLLMAKGHQVDVALFDGADTPFKRMLEQTPCTLFSLGSSPYSPRCIFKLRKLMKHYDLVHTHNTSPQFYAALANIGLHRTLVTTEHNTSNRRRQWKGFVCVDRWMYNRYKHVICISQKAEDNLRAYLGHIKATISTVLNGVDVATYHNALPDLELRASTSKFVVVMVAAFRAQKDQDTLIRAMSILPRQAFELWLVGGGDDRRQQELEDLAAGLNLTNVRFLGIRQDIPQILHAADVVVMSSHYEGFSLSCIEGMAVGKPFVASDVDGIHEMVAGAGILFPHEDHFALSEILLHLYHHPAQAEKVARSCFDRASQFDISTMVNAYEALYTSIR